MSITNIFERPKTMNAAVPHDPFRCLLCGTAETPHLVQAEVTGDSAGGLRAVQCLACSHVQLSPPAYCLDLYDEDGQVAFVVGHYGTPIEKLFEHSAIEARRRVARFAEHGEALQGRGGERARLLDVGGGYGFFGAAMAAVRPDVDTLVLEPSAKRAEMGRSHFEQRSDPAFSPPTFEVGLLDDAFVEQHRASFDAVTLWHVLEHVEDPAGLLERAGALLNPNGGTLWIEVPNLDDELSTLSPAYRRRNFMREHVSYFSPAVLERLARRAFTAASTEVVGYQRYGIFNYMHWIHANAPQGASPDMFERDRWWLEANWRTVREAARTSDALLLIVRLGGAAGAGE
ncbi:methyltransferase domain-containing protein [Allosphingosinicella deserti]|uniref:methyltransferase domain-containing protein n=1 Tax=Allosphingosinicella deserti TaxID=2116704 RepID=UPI0013048348|nr:methyltransferase domain-containing protein [Sphingomonas deserti]